METGLIYLVLCGIILVLVVAGSIRKEFHFAKFTLSLLAFYFMPGLAVAFWQGLLLFFSEQALWVTVLIGMAAGFILFEIIFKRLWGFSTFEHELSHAIVALLFFRRIKKFKVTRYDGGYVEYTNGFGGEAGNHFITLGPYFLPTFTLLSVLVRPFLPVTWFPWFDVWIGITFSYQTMNNIEELRRNWTSERFRLAGGGGFSKTDIGHEGYIFSFIMILALKLLFLSLLLFLLSNGYPALPDWLTIVWQQSLLFFKPVFMEMYAYIGKLTFKALN